MGLKIHKPNAKNLGHACTFSFQAQTAKVNDSMDTDKIVEAVKAADKSIYLEIIKQTSWDHSIKQGGFSGGEKAIVKFSQTEAADMIRSIEKNVPAFETKDPEKPNCAYHKSETGMTNIGFSPITEGYFAGTGHGIQIKKRVDGKELRFHIALTHAESRLIQEYLKFALERIFTAIHSEDKKLRDISWKKKKAAEASEKSNDKDLI